jgi:DNA-binding NarL/FixJ family response regulator
MDVRLRILETLYRYDLDLAAHAALIQNAAEQYWNRNSPVSFLSVSANSDGEYDLMLQATRDEVRARSPALREWIRTSAVADLETSCAASPVYGSALEEALRGTLNSRLITSLIDHLRVTDLLGFFSGTSEIALVALFACLDTRSPAAHSPRAQAHWQPVAGHLAAAWRLRQRLSAGAAMADLIDVSLHPDGRIRDAQIPVDATLRDALGAAVRHRERSRRTTSDQLWPELLAGRWTLIDHIEAEGKRAVVAIRNTPLAQSLCRLTAQEATALEMARAGAANKEIALNMQLAPSSVTRLLKSVTLKLNATLADLIRLLATGVICHRDLVFGTMDLSMFSPGVAAAVPVWRDLLSEAETNVIEAVLRGQSNHEIATERGSSVRTVINQLASAFEKLAIRSRRELLSWQSANLANR